MRVKEVDERKIEKNGEMEERGVGGRMREERRNERDRKRKRAAVGAL